MMPFDGYRLELLPVEGEYEASLLELPAVTAYGDTPEQAIKSLSAAYSATKEAMTDKGIKMPDPIGDRKFSGRFNVRVSRRLHEELVVEAAREGITLNAMINSALSRQFFAQTS